MVIVAKFFISYLQQVIGNEEGLLNRSCWHDKIRVLGHATAIHSNVSSIATELIKTPVPILCREHQEKGKHDLAMDP